MVHLQDLVTQLQEDESLGKQSEDTCAMTFPTSVQRSFETDEEEERRSGTERPFNTIRGCSSPDHDSVPWYDSVNYCGVAGGFWSTNDAPETLRQSSNAFVTEDAEEECARVLRGHLMLHFGTGRPFGRRFPFHGPDSQPPKLFVIVEARGGSLGVVRSSRRGYQRAHYHPYMQRGSETPGAAPRIAGGRGHATQESSSLSRNRWSSRVGIVVPLARRGRRLAGGSPGP
ncbi:hypothetical protein MTO96_038008 [Rhipicephalus appendiculatus]